MNILTEGLAVTVLGMLVVFAVLIIIALILSMFNVMANKKDDAPKADAPSTVAPVVPAPVPVATSPMDDSQLVAVITAAIIAARENNNEGTDGLVVRSIKRVNSWNKEALNHNNIF